MFIFGMNDTHTQSGRCMICPLPFVKTKCWTQLAGRNSRSTDGFLLVSWAFCPRATSIWIASRVPGEWSWLKAIGIPEPKHVVKSWWSGYTQATATTNWTRLLSLGPVFSACVAILPQSMAGPIMAHHGLVYVMSCFCWGDITHPQEL